MRGLWARAITAIAVILGAVGAGSVSSSPPPEHGLGDDLKKVVEEEAWRAGGPREDRMLDLFRQAIESGKPEAVGAVEDVLWPLFYRRWLDPTRFAECLEGPGGDLAHVWRAELALWKLSASERRRAYSEVLCTGRQNHELGLAWGVAAHRALLEHMDDLVPEIEATAETSPHTAAQRAETRVAPAALLELARARSGDWEANYLELIGDQLKVQANATDWNSGSSGNRLIREALLELVHSGNTRLLTPLKVLWRSIKDPEMEEPKNQRAYAEAVRRGLRDPDYPRPGLAADELVCAIQALGSPSFQEKNSERQKLLEETRRRLAKAGWLRPTVDVR